MTRMDFKPSVHIVQIIAACEFRLEERSGFGAHGYKFLPRVYTRAPYLTASD